MHSLRTVLSGITLGLVLALTLSLQSGSAACGPNNRSDYCSDHYGMLGDLSAVAGRTSVVGADYPAVAPPELAPAGELIYVDMKAMEIKARGLLKSSADFRTTISPSLNKPDFDRLVRQFDYASGFIRDLDGAGPGTMTLQQRIDQADADLRLARDIYAFLAVYANIPRFKADPDYSAALCARPDNINPPVDPTHPDVVPEPVIDWCNFAARMRQSVREAAYLRMIFGQQFTADALGLHFSGTEIVGGEAFVRDELRKLQLAVLQYQQAEQFVAEGLIRPVGSGCLISDFYSQAEWSLLSRASDGRRRAEHEIAVRKSYLDDYGPTAAQADYQAAAMGQYVKLVGTSGVATGPSAIRCARGERPDGAILAEMALNVLETQNNSRTLAAGRNVFGFDVTFTPARPFRTAFGSNDTGILDEARRAAQDAKTLQRDEEAATREFDQKVEKLTAAIQALKNGRDEVIQAEAGCDRADPSLPTDAAYFACVQQTIDTLESCNPDPNQMSDTAFNACVLQAPVSTMRQSRQELRATFLRIRQVQVQMANIVQRAQVEVIRNIKVKNSLYNAASESAVFEAIIAIGHCCPITYPPIQVQIDLGAALEAGLRPGAILRQAAHDMEVEDANSEAVVRNLFLDQAELQTDLDIAVQETAAKLTEYEGVRDQTKHDVIEAQRERAYLQNSPANDPSYRLVRDSKRLTLANQLEYAERVAYLAARRAEYEYAARLSASGFRISDIYRARTADDILQFVTRLDAITNNLVVSDAEINQEDFRLSVALHILGLTDQVLGLSGPDAEAERIRRFREWVAENTQRGTDGKPVLNFNFTTSIVENGIFSNVIQQGFQRFWLFKIGGIGQPKPTSNGVTMNLVSNQTGTLRYRRVAMTQGGLTHLRTRAGCIFDYRLIQPASLVGQEWPSNQPPEQATTDFKASINGANGERTAAFLSRPVSATNWQAQIFAGAPETGLADLDLQQLNDIELVFSTTRASRQPGQPQPSDCVRADFKGAE